MMNNDENEYTRIIVSSPPPYNSTIDTTTTTTSSGGAGVREGLSSQAHPTPPTYNDGFLHPTIPGYVQTRQPSIDSTYDDLFDDVSPANPSTGQGLQAHYYQSLDSLGDIEEEPKPKSPISPTTERLVAKCSFDKFDAELFRRYSVSHDKIKSPTRRFFDFFLLTINTLGVIYGDLGTSPLYVLTALFSTGNAFGPNHAINEQDIIGVLSLIIYTLTIVVTIKYVLLILNADAKGEGGIFALLSLIPTDPRKVHPAARHIFVLISLLGASLLLGDGIITPAISVLSAVEGLKTQSAEFAPAVVPVTCTILVLLFLLQRVGTAKVGMLFGPIMLLWFVSLSSIGVFRLLDHPSILIRALNPYHAYVFFKHNGFYGWVALGSVVLCITGVEAMYADLGHFGKSPIRASWLFIVYPSLIINYSGQCAHLLKHREHISNPFFYSVPTQVYWPVLVLSTLATIIASQAMISGAFSLVSQADALQCFPRVRILHTSTKMRGQIYIPEINYLFMLLTLLVVLAFRSSTKLANAYGVAVTGDMVLSTIMFAVVLRTHWKLPIWAVIPLLLPIFVVDLSFASSTSLKVATGGWVALVFCALFAGIMIVWYLGRRMVAEAETRQNRELSLDDVKREIRERRFDRCELGTGIFMSSVSTGVPTTLTCFVDRTHMLPHQIVFLTVRWHERLPYVPEQHRLRYRILGDGFYQLVATYGFMNQKISVQEILTKAQRDYGLRIERPLTFFLRRQIVVPSKSHWFPLRLLLRLYNFLVLNARSPQQVFNIKHELVIEVGTKIEV